VFVWGNETQPLRDPAPAIGSRKKAGKVDCSLFAQVNGGTDGNTEGTYARAENFTVGVEEYGLEGETTDDITRESSATGSKTNQKLLTAGNLIKDKQFLRLFGLG